MTKWWSGEAIGFDTETDGPDPTDARIIQFAVTRIAPGLTAPATDMSIVQPERDIDLGAVAVHGISTELAQETGMPRIEAVEYLCSLLAQASKTVPVVAHNASYDMTVLDREMRRLGLGSLGIEDGLVALRRDGKTWATFPIIDTLVLDKALDPYRPGKGGRRLEKVAEQYGVPMAEGAAHAADADVLASLRIAWVIAKRCSMAVSAVADRYMDRRKPYEIAEKFYDVGAMSLRDLHAAQVPWAAEQAAGLAKYFKANPDLGVDPADVNGDWPFHPYV